MSREKQIEEMIKAIEKCSCVYTPCEQECAQCSNAEIYDETINHIARTVYEAGYRKQEWISVDERLPDGNGRFLTVDKKGYMMVCYWEKRFGWFAAVCNKNAITHWMPLPPPPEKEKSNG